MAIANPRGLGRCPGATTTTAREPADLQQRPSASQSRHTGSAPVQPTSSEVAADVLQHLAAEIRITRGSRHADAEVSSPAGVRGTRQSKRPPSPMDNQQANAEEASTSDSTPSKKRREKVALSARRPRAKAALNFGSDAEKGSEPASQGAQAGASVDDVAAEMNARTDEAAEQPLQQTATKGTRVRQRAQGKRTSPKPKPQLQPRTRAATQQLESRQLRPRPAPAIAAPVTPAKPVGAPVRARGLSKQEPKEAVAKTGKRVPLKDCQVDGHTYRVGDCAFVITDENWEVEQLSSSRLTICVLPSLSLGQLALHACLQICLTSLKSSNAAALICRVAAILCSTGMCGSVKLENWRLAGSQSLDSEAPLCRTMELTRRSRCARCASRQTRSAAGA